MGAELTPARAGPPPGAPRASQNESEVEAKRTRRRRPGSVCALLRVFLPVWGVTEAIGAGEAQGHLDPTEGTPVAPSCPFTTAQRAQGPAWASVSVSVYGGGAQLACGGDPRQSVGDPRAHLCCPHGCRESASRRQRRVSAPVSAGALPTCRFDWPSLGTVSIQL